MQEDQLVVAEKWCAMHLDHIHCFCLKGNLDHYIQHNNLIFAVDCVDMMDALFLIFGFCCALCYHSLRWDLDRIPSVKKARFTVRMQGPALPAIC